MQFTLYYRGRLESNAGPPRKHSLRQTFHQQLAQLWTQPPLSQVKFLLDDVPVVLAPTLIRKVGAFRFAPLVTGHYAAVAELNLTILRPGPVGDIFSQSGDIDNRLKTLFDSLSVPQINAIPPNTPPGSDEDPFYCLLEDDKLISDVKVKTRQLLESNLHNSEVALFIDVRTNVAHRNRINDFLI